MRRCDAMYERKFFHFPVATLATAAALALSALSPLPADETPVKETLTLKGHDGFVMSVSWSPDGKRVATACHDKTVKVWDAEKGQEALTLKGHTDVVMSVSWSPDGKRLASASLDKTVKVWDAEKGKETLTLKGHADIVVSVN